MSETRIENGTSKELQTTSSDSVENVENQENVREKNQYIPHNFI